MDYTVLDYLQEKKIYVEASCGGAGTCGKCKVTVNGKTCLACRTKYADGMEITVSEKENITALGVDVSGKTDSNSEYGLAVDIGTTTIAFALVDLKSGNPVFSHGTTNSQRALGADVISRIKAADEGKLELLNKHVLQDILDGISYVSNESGVAAEKIIKMAVAANTTMLHILVGANCRSLGQYPFTPVFIDMQQKPFYEIFKTNTLSCDVILLPGISTYVGADIVAGISYGFSLGDSGLLIDLGTNGEIALFSEDEVVGTATAAGPAFEAGNISCGTGSVTGAISRAVFLPDKKIFEYETINNGKPVGLCGSGLLDVAAQLLLNNYIDEAGSMDDDFIIAENVIITPKDIRELQLAKSAVRSGIEILLEECGKTYDNIDNIYLAGGFGHTLNVENAFILGVLPEKWKTDKITAVGNSSLAGCIRYLTRPDMFSFLSKSREINLSAHPRFNDLFMEYMMFEV